MIDGTDYRVRPFWNPDYLIYLEPELGGEPILLAEIAPNATVTWQMVGLQKLQVESAEAANHSVIFHSRRWP